MKMKREDVLRMVIKELKAAQYAIQEEAVTVLESTKPIGDLKDFDSLTSVCVTARCFESLGVPSDDPMQVPSLFIDSSGSALTVGEIVDRILELLNKK